MLSVNSNMSINSNLEDLVKEHRIFIDLSSLKNPNFRNLTYKLQPILIKYKKKLVILKSILNRLNKESIDFSKKYPYRLNDFEKNLKVIEALHTKNLIEFKSESTKVFGKFELMTKFYELRSKYKLLLITEDYDVAKDILSFNNFTATPAFKIIVRKINKLGYLEEFNEKTSKNKEIYSNNISIVPKEEIFPIGKEIDNTSDGLLNVTNIPSENNFVMSDNKQIIKLLKLLAEGGEGSVYTTDTKYVCKIYKKEKLTERKLKKLKLMLTRKLSCEGICWPVSLVYNANNEFVGYLMPKAEGKEVQKCLFYKKLLLENFPTWKKRDMVQLCITILEKIEFLHARNIILGDINPLNILVVNPKKVYFVDTDSYQVVGFPCPVGTINYTAPEIQGKNFNETLRSFGNEYFAISTLLFMLMMGGKPPYSKKGGESQKENIIKMDFSYPLGENSNGKAPEGNWIFMWSHLPYSIKESFYNTFRKNRKNSSEENRISTKKWRGEMGRYLNLLDKGVLTGQDTMADELFPNRYKIVKNKN